MQQEQNASLIPTGRGKGRFALRKEIMKQQQADEAPQGVFKSVFALPKSSTPNPRKRNLGSPKPTKGGEGAAKPKSLSIDKEATADDDHGQTNKEREQHAITKHSPLYDALNPKSRTPSAALFQKFITLVILMDALIYVLSTEPGLSHLSSTVFYYSEAVTSSIFAIEYGARLGVCYEKRCFKKYGPAKGRWRYMCTSRAVIDAFATFPFFIELLSGIPLPTLTYLRVFRVLRITRTQSYSQAMDAVLRVLYFNREILHVAAVLGMYLVVITSILMYYLRPRGTDAENVEDASDFQSISSTMVLSILMLTGQGGPSGSLPWYTQLVVLLTGVFSVAMFAIPASMLTWGFEAEAERLGARAKKRAIAKKRGERYESDVSSSSSSSSCNSDFSTSDEEYMNIIGGDDDDDNEMTMESMRSLARRASLGQDDMQSLLSRVEKLEGNVAQTNVKLDLILKKLEEK